MADQILKQTLSIIVGDTDENGSPKPGAEEFVFRVPTPLEKARVGVREASIMRAFDPTGLTSGYNVDPETLCLIRGMAVMETLLEKANTTWPFQETKGTNGEPTLVVDINKFPPGKETVISEVGLKFQDALDRFHRDGAGRTQSAVPQAVDGGGNPGAL